MTNLKERFENLLPKLNLEMKKARISEIEQLVSRPDFWQDSEDARSRMRELAALQEELSLVSLIEEELGQDNALNEASPSFAELGAAIRKLEIKTLLSGPYDRLGAVISIHSGQGGTEAMDWASMLKRMYERYADRLGFEVVVVDESLGEEAGIKSTVMEIKGDFAYGYLKGEAGVHRLVRQSPFNANHLRQTSFAMAEVTPLFDEGEDSDEFELKEDDLIIETFRASSHGGQNVQKVETAVRVKHKPTGITVASQTQRYQAQNRQIAMQILKSRILAARIEERKAEHERLKGTYKVPGWGNQIRSYVLHPYKLVKDLRTGIEITDPQKVLDGELDSLIEAELLAGIGTF